ncbi:NAD(P)/FAD-dependent oxidoreductase [Erythrobacter litoralis]|uniref:NAD(P)/FAD-dependent oxidoreductase n=1 Tax=Erythrobacter litoralis TaxID=39960 RepID=UPI0024351B5F|nr:FAD-dependent oxidoreductase [Erythrobacter litoralis]
MSKGVLCLIGAGHAHLGVIDAIRKGKLEAERVLLVEPRTAMQYSGMVPGWMAGEYTLDQTRIPLAPLVEEAGLEWHREEAIAVSPTDRTIVLESERRLTFDVCSLAIGGAGQAAAVLGCDERLLDIRPIDGFVARWSILRNSANRIRDIAVVGGGAGGAELAFGAANDPAFDAHITLIAGEGGLLPEMSAMVRRRAKAEYARQSIRVIEKEAQFVNGSLAVEGEELPPFDLVVAAVGSGAPEWPARCGLPVNADGFLEVDEHQRVCGIPHIFAAGDVAHRTDSHIPHSGVHAVYAGPILARNLQAALKGRAPRNVYRGRGMDFYLLNTGRGAAILSYGPLGTRARWLRCLKDWLDRRWIARFTNPAA